MNAAATEPATQPQLERAALARPKAQPFDALVAEASAALSDATLPDAALPDAMLPEVTASCRSSLAVARAGPGAAHRTMTRCAAMPYCYETRIARRVPEPEASPRRPTPARI